MSRFFCLCFGKGRPASIDEPSALQNSSVSHVQRPAATSAILSFCSRQSQGWDVSSTERARAAGSRTRKDADVVQLATARYMQLFAAAKNDDAGGVASLYDTDVRAMQDSVRSVRSGSDGTSGQVAQREYSRQAASRESSSRFAYACSAGAGPLGPPSAAAAAAAANSLHRRSVSSVRHDSPALDALPEQATTEGAAAAGGSGVGEYTSYTTGAATGSFKKSGSLSRVLGPFTSKGNMRSPGGTPRSTSDRAMAAASALPAPLGSPSTKSMSRANTGGFGGAMQALGLGRLHGAVGASASYSDLRVGARTSSITHSATGPTSGAPGQGQGQGQGQQQQQTPHQHGQQQGQVSRAGSVKGVAAGVSGLQGTASSRRSRLFNEHGPVGGAAGTGGGSGSMSAVAAAALSGGVSSMPMGVTGPGGAGPGVASSNGYRQASVSAVLPAAAYLDSPATVSSGAASGAMAAALSPYVMAGSGGGGGGAVGSGGGGGPSGNRRSTIVFSKHDVTVTGLPPSCLTSGRLPRCRDSTSGVLMQVPGGGGGGAAGGAGGSYGPQSSRLGRNSTDLMSVVARTASAVVPPSAQSAMLAAAGASDYPHLYAGPHHTLVDRSGMSMDLGRASRNGMAAAAHRNAAGGAGMHHASSAVMLSALAGGGQVAIGHGSGPLGRAPVVPAAASGDGSNTSLGARCRMSQVAAAAGAGPRPSELGSRTMSAQLEHGSPRARLTHQGQLSKEQAGHVNPDQQSAPLPLAQSVSQPLLQSQPLSQPTATALPQPVHGQDATAVAAAAATAAAAAVAASANSSEAGARCDWVGSSLYAQSRCSDSSRLTNIRQPGGNGAGVGLTTTATGTSYNDPSSCALGTVQAPPLAPEAAGAVGGAKGGGASYVRQGTSNTGAAGQLASGDTGTGAGTGTGTGGTGGRAESRLLSQHTTGGCDARLTPGAGAGGATAGGEVSRMLSTVMVGDDSSTANNSSLLAPLPPGADLAAAAAAAALSNPLFVRVSASGRSGTGIGYTGNSNALFSALPDNAVSGANALNAAVAAAAAAAGGGGAQPAPSSALPVVVQLPANSALALATEARDVSSALNRLQEACLLAQKVDVSQRLTNRISLSIEHGAGPRPSAAGWASSMHGMGSSGYGAFGGGGGAGGMSASLGPALSHYSFTNSVVAGGGAGAAGGPPTEGRASYTRTASASAALMQVRMGRPPPRASLSRSHLAGGAAMMGAAGVVVGGGMPGHASAIVGYLEDIHSEPWVDPEHPDHPDNSNQPSRMQLRTGLPGDGGEEGGGVDGDGDGDGYGDGDGDGGGIVMDGSNLFGMGRDAAGSVQASIEGSAAGMNFAAAMVPAILYAGSSVVPTAASATGAGGFGFANGGFGNGGGGGGGGVSQSAYSAVLMASAAGDAGFTRRSSNIGQGGSVEMPAGARTMAAVVGAGGAYGSTGSVGVGVGVVGGGYSSQGRPQGRLNDDPSEDPQTQAMLNVLLQGDFLESKDSGLPASDDEDDGPVEYRYGGFELGGGAEGGDDYRRQHSFVEAVRRIGSERGGHSRGGSPAGSPSGTATPAGSGLGPAGRPASVVNSGAGGRHSPRNSPRTALARRAVVNNLVGSGVAASGGSSSLLGIQLKLDGAQ